MATRRKTASPPARGARAAAPPPATGVREQILDAAVRVLREDGVRQFTQTRVAERAGVRQSHLTYYFATRDALLGETATRIVEMMAHHAGHAPTLDSLSRSIVDADHMRMFVGLCVEADRDPAVRDLVRRGTERMVDLIASTMTGRSARPRARAMLATLWGLGLYELTMAPSAAQSPTRPALEWLEHMRVVTQGGGAA